MKTEFKFMQPVAVSHKSEDRAVASLDTDVYDYYYLFTCKDGRHHTRWIRKSNGDEGTCWHSYTVAIPEKKKIPYTFETFPKCYTLVRRKSTPNAGCSVIRGLSPYAILTTESEYRFGDMASGIELSFDSGETWVPFWLEE